MEKAITPSTAQLKPWWAPLKSPNGAVVSPCGRYRLLLWRSLRDDGKPLGYHMLNPSKAGAVVSDPTMTRCLGFAGREGASGIILTNLSPWRTPKPSELESAHKSGEDVLLMPANVIAIRLSLMLCSKLILAWGANYRPWVDSALYAVQHLAGWTNLWCFGMTENGHPRHPLMLRADTPLVQFQGCPHENPTTAATRQHV